MVEKLLKKAMHTFLVNHLFVAPDEESKIFVIEYFSFTIEKNEQILILQRSHYLL